VTVQVVDQHNLLVPRSSNLIQFQVDGPGTIVATDNGDATSFEPFQTTARHAFNALALVIVRANPGQTGSITLRATSPGLKAASVRIRTTPDGLQR
jgi:beta-galactosidase